MAPPRQPSCPAPSAASPGYRSTWSSTLTCAASVSRPLRTPAAGASAPSQNSSIPTGAARRTRVCQATVCTPSGVVPRTDKRPLACNSIRCTLVVCVYTPPAPKVNAASEASVGWRGPLRAAIAEKHRCLVKRHTRTGRRTPEDGAIGQGPARSSAAKPVSNRSCGFHCASSPEPSRGLRGIVPRGRRRW